MNKRMIAIAVAAGISSQFPVTNEPRFNYAKITKGNKYKPHQEKKERNRRINKLKTNS